MFGANDVKIYRCRLIPHIRSNNNIRDLFSGQTYSAVITAKSFSVTFVKQTNNSVNVSEIRLVERF